MSDILLDLPGILAKNRPFVLCIITSTEGSSPRKAGSKMVVFADSTQKGTIGGGSVEKEAAEIALEVLKTQKPLVKKFILEEDLAMQCGGTVTLYFEPIIPNPDLYIFGAGHVGREVGRYASENGFTVHFIDFRKDIYAEFDCTYAECITDDFLEAASGIEFKETDYVVITTPKHEFDERLSLILGKKKLTYLGMIGSKSKVAEVRKNALEKGALTPQELDRINMPIGVPMNSQTPREIAISILAKLIDVKNSR
jgi:xanthine dehydrogenase accessory factor